MNLHTDQATLDHARETGLLVLFGEGEHTPPGWMVDFAKPCETCEGSGADPGGLILPCRPCGGDGRQQHTIIVPCIENHEHVGPCNRIQGQAGGYITVPEVAVVEFGPELQDDGQYAIGFRLVMSPVSG
jgi:hypothetical protein